MAYKSEDLTDVSYGNGFMLWHYKTDDTSADIESKGYFNGASSKVQKGDFILATLRDGDGIYVVQKAGDGVVVKSIAGRLGSAD